MFIDEDSKELVHQTMFYDVDLPLSYLHDYKTNQISNSLICDEKHSSVGIILILSHYYNIPYDKESIPQCLQDNNYVRDYVKFFCQSLHTDKVIQLRHKVS
jgi:hypothetical protein